MKTNKRRIISGLLAAVMMCSTIVGSSFTAQAETNLIETESEADSSTETQTPIPDLSDVLEKLDETEIVTAYDLTIMVGEAFDVKTDFTNLKIDSEKVRVTLQEAKNAEGQEFDYNKADTYKAVYMVEPMSGNPTYLVSRQIIVCAKELSTETSTSGENTAQDSTKEDESESEEGEPELASDVEKGEDIVIDEENGVVLAAVPSLMSTRSSVTLVKGKWVQYPSNLGNYSTYYYYVNGKIAYCLEAAKGSPADAGYIAEILESNENVQKALYYGYGGAGDLTEQFMPGFGDDLKYVFTHIAASYAYCGIDGFYGCTMADLEACGVLGFINFLFSQELPPQPDISFSSAYEAAYLDGELQRTNSITLNSDYRNSITLEVPQNVTYHSGMTEITGSSVKIYGGTTFYFTAPKTIGNSWKTAEMSGSISSTWKTLVLTTGNGTQDIGYGDFISQSASPVSFEIKWMDIARVSIIKKDKKTNVNLEGAVFGIYRDKACTDLIAKMPATDKSGASTMEIVKTQNTVYLKEIEVPKGYLINTESYQVDLVVGQTTTVAITNEEQLGKITINKTGEVLTGVKGNNPVTFLYTNANFLGAEYDIYAADDVYSQDKTTLIYKKGTLVQHLITNSTGKAESKELSLGRYKIVETSAPKNLTIGKTEEKTTQYVTLSYQGQNVQLAQEQAEYQNERPTIDLSVVKKSKTEQDVTLEGAVFQLYAGQDIKDNSGNVLVAKDTVIEAATSDTNGKAVFQSDIPLNYTYYIKEAKAPTGYYKNDKTFTFTYTYKDDKTYVYQYEGTFENEEVRGSVHISKIDIETNAFLSQGDAELSGAVYGLYAKNDIIHPNKKTGVIYQKNELVAQGTISKEGTLDFTDLYLGDYYVREITPPYGYVLDETTYDVQLAYEGEDVKVVERNVVVKEQVKKQAFQLIKISEDGEQTEVELAAGAGFTIYLISNLSKVKDQTLVPSEGNSYTAKDFIGYDFTKEESAVLYENGKAVPIPELITDQNGYVKSPEIPFGQYVVIESTTPENLDTIAPFLVNVQEDSREPQIWRIFDDRPFQFLFKIVKKDAQTGKEVLNNPASYKIFNMDTEEYVEQIVYYPKYEKISVFQTNEEGYLITPEQLKSGTYRIEEVAAPDSYVKAGFEESLTYDGSQIPLTQLTTQGVYEQTPSSAIVVDVNSNTVHQVEEETNKNIIIIEQYNNEQVGSLTLTKTGEHLKEVQSQEESFLEKVKNGFNSTITAVTNFFQDKDTFINEKYIDFTYENGGVEGAEFKVYAKDIIYTPDGQKDENGERIVIYAKDALVATLITDQEGKATLNNLPLGTYYMKETVASNSFTLNTEVKEFELKSAGDEAAVSYANVDYYNERQHVEISVLKKDEVTENPIENVVFGLYAEEDICDKDGNIIVSKDTLIEQKASDKDGKITFASDLPHGKYYIKEDIHQPGYLPNTEKYTFDASYQDQNLEKIVLSVEVTNQPTITEIEKSDIVTGDAVVGAELQIINSDNEVIEEWVTTGETHMIYALAPGVYTLRETIAGYGYLIAEDVEFTVLESGEILCVEMKDERAMGRIKLHKTDESTKEALENVEFELIEKSTGRVLATLITDKDGNAVSDLLDIGSFQDGQLGENYVYILKETKALEGYELDGQEYELTFDYKDDKTAVIEIEKSITNKKIPTETVTAPKTGDNTDILLPLLLVIGSIGIISYTLWKRKSRLQTPKESD